MNKVEAVRQSREPGEKPEEASEEEYETYQFEFHRALQDKWAASHPVEAASQLYIDAITAMYLGYGRIWPDTVRTVDRGSDHART